MLRLVSDVLGRIAAQAEKHYPEETAGLLLGVIAGSDKVAVEALPFANRAPEPGRRTRYLIDPREVLAAEDEADRRGLHLIGVYHSHPDHPAVASAFDLRWALPWFSYLIVSVREGTAVESRSWRLSEDRSRMVEEEILTEVHSPLQEKA